MVGLLKRYGFGAVIALGLLAMTLVVFGKTVFATFAEGQASAALAGGANGRAGAATPVVVTVIAAHSFSDAIQAIGTAQARESIVLTPKVADTIRAIRFESGARVRRGQVLVEMSSVEQAAALAEARAANQAAQEELGRYQELFERGFASQARLDAVRASADAAEARLNGNASRIADRTIRAPFAGVVGLRTASPGQYVRPGEQIGTLDDLSEIKLDFSIPETQMAQLTIGAAIIAHAAAFPARMFEGRIANVDSRVDPTTRTVQVRAILPNADEALRPGMLLTVEVRSNPREGLAAPEIAVLDQGDSAYVFRVVAGDQGERAERVEIAIGQRSAGLVEVVNGLSAGDRVITEGMQSVRPGQPVRVGAAAAAGDAARRPRG